MDLSGGCSPRQFAASMAGPLTHRPQGFEFGSMATPLMDQEFNPSILTHTSVHQQQQNAGPRVPMSNHSLNTFGETPLSNHMGYTDPAIIALLAAQAYLSSAAGGNQRLVSPFGTEDVGGE